MLCKRIKRLKGKNLSPSHRSVFYSFADTVNAENMTSHNEFLLRSFLFSFAFSRNSRVVSERETLKNILRKQTHHKSFRLTDAGLANVSFGRFYENVWGKCRSHNHISNLLDDGNPRETSSFLLFKSPTRREFCPFFSRLMNTRTQKTHKLIASWFQSSIDDDSQQQNLLKPIWKQKRIHRQTANIFERQAWNEDEKAKKKVCSEMVNELRIGQEMDTHNRYVASKQF